MDGVTNVICSFAEESKVNDDIKHITSHQIKHIQTDGSLGSSPAVNQALVCV